MRQTVIIIGATSDIARATAMELAKQYDLVLVGRNETELEAIASDLSVRSDCQVQTYLFDARNLDTHAELVATWFEEVDTVAGAVVCHGFLPEQTQAQRDWELAHQTLDVNFISCVALLEPLMDRLESQQESFLAVVSSVAGDRGRQSNYIYGAAKGGLSVYLQGLRNRGTKSGVHVLTVKPGFVATAMTIGLVDPKSPLVAAPEKVARDIVRGIRKRKNVIYSRWFWRYIMLVIRVIPEWIFKRLSL